MLRKDVDIIRLLSTDDLEYDIVCGLDFYTRFYDHYATRDILFLYYILSSILLWIYVHLNGDWFADHYPFVRHASSQALAR